MGLCTCVVCTRFYSCVGHSRTSEAGGRGHAPAVPYSFQALYLFTKTSVQTVCLKSVVRMWSLSRICRKLALLTEQLFEHVQKHSARIEIESIAI